MFRLRIALFLSLCSSAAALGPHEVAVLVNRGSQRSLEIANHFVNLRKIPSANVILLQLPDSVLASEAEMSPEDFTKYIWEPAKKVIRDRRIEDHILAWAYSSDFPIRITSDPPVSLQGITFVRNVLPEAGQITDGTYLSPLFRGPDKLDGPAGETITLERFTPMLRQAMPLPSMMLGYTGARGLTSGEVTDYLKRGAASDRSAPSDGIYWVTNSDIRSRCRDWQFENVKTELQALNVRGELVTNVPGKGRATIGLQTGASWVDTANAAAFLPGAMAEHLTSFGAFFHDADQTKLTEWLRAGATASSGTIAEPKSIWSKFPSGRFFKHYVSGCTMIESFFLSVRCPMELLIVGDPLAKPWAQPVELTLVNLEEEDQPVRDTANFLATVWAGMDQPAPEMLFLIDGRAIAHAAGDPSLKLDTRQLTDGYHDLRVVAYARQQVRHQSFSSVGFQVANRGRACRIEAVTNNQVVDIDRTLRLGITAAGEPQEMAIIAQERVLVRGKYAANATLPIDPKVLGLGPVTLQAVALYPTNEAVRSPPVQVRIARLNQAPTVEIVATDPDTNGTARLRAVVSDPENDNTTVEWFTPLGLQQEMAVNATIEHEADGAALTLRANSDIGLAQTRWPGATNATQFTAQLSVPPDWPLIKKQVAALVFDYRDENNFSFFGLFGDTSSWVMGRRENGTWHRVVTRGTYLQPDTWYDVTLRSETNGGVTAWLNNEYVCAWPEGRLAGGGFGLCAGPEGARARDLMISPPCLPDNTFRVEEGMLLVQDPSTATGTTIVARGRDVSHSADASWRME